jgi:hypothetical protein
MPDRRLAEASLDVADRTPAAMFYYRVVILARGNRYALPDTSR